MRVRTLAVGLLVGGLALTACGKEGTPGDTGSQPPPQQDVATDVKVADSPTFDRIKGRGKVIIGVKEDQPGLGFKDPTTGKYSGFDIEIANLVAAKLGFKPEQVEYKAVASAGREAAIANGNVDYYVGTYTINAKRKEQISFAGPYFTAGQDLLVRKDNTDITGPETLKGKKVCSVTGSTPIQKVRNDKLTDQIVELQTYSQCVTQLDQKQIDAVTTDDAILKGYAAQESTKFKVVGKTFSQEPYGIGLPKDDKAFKDKVTQILQGALDDGTWQKIYDNTLGKSGSPATKPTLDKS
ncbi:glutamate ABC transporter substrate-binding protein [Kibdelosporangium phytohabitans]|uniref:ABC transporter substrate-binding protein n=1 Tax=Kibdelosporangium phytohabitans TaxID=860235 RepID=A0A0N7F380_9PSEU|nr:glutamate ABC transporter substrate-binding protein [Kibdelosporangium phytohabitans]ALG07887.1 ABC transporter substrate-binding protein [Kibdelosporangium phytohabitans]MBE1471181.1 glutamate transport system substrate-binding protein [Kibdelosporangium phytohabitans]